MFKERDDVSLEKAAPTRSASHTVAQIHLPVKINVAKAQGIFEGIRWRSIVSACPVVKRCELLYIYVKIYIIAPCVLIFSMKSFIEVYRAIYTSLHYL